MLLFHKTRPERRTIRRCKATNELQNFLNSFKHRPTLVTTQCSCYANKSYTDLELLIFPQLRITHSRMTHSRMTHSLQIFNSIFYLLSGFKILFGERRFPSPENFSANALDSTVFKLEYFYISF